ncbi:UNVERIFIED_CONTAM: hypothetical protein Sradi_2038200 [Sesamum radiatum]|uniref:Retrotransposon gag domain-containing protein n=1 Tax=Sesamum radiatum TaxID=300843 RepID=A0AAW2TH70_SESRA
MTSTNLRMKCFGQSNHTTKSTLTNHVGESRDDGIALPLKFALKLGAKQKAQVAENDLLDDTMIHSSSISSTAEIATVMMVQTTSLDEQIASLTATVGNLLKYVQARDDQLNKLHNKFQSTPALNEFEEQDFLIECNTSKGIPVSTNGFVSIEHVKNTMNEAIANAYDARAQSFKSYIKPYTKRIEQLRVPENYQPPKFQQFNGHGDPRQHLAHFVETCNNAGTDGDLLVKQFVISLKDAAFDWYIDLEANSIDSWDDLQNKFFSCYYSVRRTISMIEIANQHQEKDESVLDYINNWRNLSLNCKYTLSEISAVELCIQGMSWELCYILQAIKSKTFGELVTRAHEIEMSFNCKDECLVDASEDDGEDDDATP